MKYLHTKEGGWSVRGYQVLKCILVLIQEGSSFKPASVFFVMWNGLKITTKKVKSRRCRSANDSIVQQLLLKCVFNASRRNEICSKTIIIEGQNCAKEHRPPGS